MSFQREDMEVDYYKWDENPDQQLFSGEPSRRLFNRYNGDQVLFIINCYGALSEKFTTSQAKEIELEIINHLPLDAKSEISVLNWIRSLYSVKEKESL